MFKTTELIKIISGQRTDGVARATRCALGCLVPIYRIGLGYRSRKFESKVGVNKVNAPVISVGNLTTGGTGKTPMVSCLIQHLEQLNFKPALLSRGYARGENEKNDEALELESRLPGTIHLQDGNRTRIANQAIDDFGCNVLVMDDGFQHRALHRDLDIVLIDATQPFGYGHLLPRGLLREPLSSLVRADAIVLTRVDQISDTEKNEIRETVQFHNPRALWVETQMKPTGWLELGAAVYPIDHLDSKGVFAFSGIGNPVGFRQSLEQLSLQVVGERVFPDHHDYLQEEVSSMVQQADSLGAEAIICTHKDLVKVERLATKLNRTVFALQIEVDFVQGQPELFELIEKVVTNSLEA